ncbi:hypothetical protein ABB37_01658 [Leptomonas pyrrhocoris]|uniref:Uncharacterized protein n=1 Tax=Leptomonas pyrrhocoris TaxID=157538 RepID=A0A0M9G9G4_LEPPY|nr:hypothetical protein ABB37_01658 [Leptomonas pyrrhocoris]KPA85329.1 hypothetical protein ABB37_01658 [Leptomonas pyrrhocoris]|eukprot:XP_015663768.1 hypothetical protein ABB37_01658 [Leptomonas pyrrhocoris]
MRALREVHAKTVRLCSGTLLTEPSGAGKNSELGYSMGVEIISCMQDGALKLRNERNEGAL